MAKALESSQPTVERQAVADFWASCEPSRGLAPWQYDAWRQWQRLDAAGRGKAVLFAGPEGLGKATLAQYALLAVVCESPRSLDTATAGSAGATPDDNAVWPCGTCAACTALRGARSEAVLTLLPQGRTREHTVDAVRDVTRFLSLASRRGRAVLIVDADRLNVSAANALLKTLEEPPAGARLLLTSSHPSRLPATIRSRCARIALAAPEAADLAAACRTSAQDPAFLDAWLKTQGAPSALFASMESDDETVAERDALRALVDAALTGGPALARAVAALVAGDAARQIRRLRALIHAALFVRLAPATCGAAALQAGDDDAWRDAPRRDRQTPASAHQIWVDAFERWLGHERWAAFTAALRTEAGFVLLDASRAWLRDADAPLVAKLRWDAIVNAFHGALRAGRRADR